MTYPIYQQACRALGLLEDAREWIQCSTAAILYASGTALRTLFAIGIIYGGILDPRSLWIQFREHICDDLHYRLQQQAPVIPPDLIDPHFDYGLYLLSLVLEEAGKTLLDSHLSPVLGTWIQIAHENILIATELMYNMQLEQESCVRQSIQLNPERRTAYDTITQQITTNAPNAQLFIQGPAGTGKTFLYECLCYYYQAKGKIVLCVASSGIAALLLPGGHTADSRFAIPLNIHELSVCRISSENSRLADLIRQTTLIIWDEVPRQYWYCFEAVNRTLNDICDTSEEGDFFGHIPVILGGDFAQIAPVIRRGNRAATVYASLQSSLLWKHFKLLTLTHNMRVQAGANNLAFATWLATMSYDPAMYNNLTLPSYIQKYTLPSDLVHLVYPPALMQTAARDFNIFTN